MTDPYEERTVEVKQESLNIERVALAAVVALLSWNVYTTNQLSLSQVRTEEQISAMRTQVFDLPNRAVSPAAYAVDKAAIQVKLDRYENWLGRLSDRVNALETGKEVIPQ